MLKSIKQTLERSREENIDAITVILNQREQDYRTNIEKLELERHQSLAYLEDLVSNQNTILNKLRLHSRQLTSEIETVLEQKSEIVQEMTVENQELRMKLSNAYERLEQTDTQLLQHNETHVKLKQRLIELNGKLKEYENIVCKCLSYSDEKHIDELCFRSTKSKRKI
jgi:chromosome segregation ATPase